MRKRRVGPFYVSIVGIDNNPAWLSSQRIIKEFKTLKDAKALAGKIANTIDIIGSYNNTSDIGFILVLCGKDKTDNPYTLSTKFAKDNFLKQNWGSVDRCS